MQLIRDLYYLAAEAAQVPVRLIQALAEGVALGWESARPSDDDCVDEITHGPKWGSSKDLPVKASVIKWGLVDLALTNEARYGFDTSSADGEAISPAAEESPSPDCVIRPAPGEGHPKLEWVAALGLRAWINGETCTAPTYYRSIACDLERLTK